MAQGVVFNITNYELDNLVSEVDSGIIALPELQRPFVWKDTQIRDLIDSLYKGLPTGLIILWKIGDGDGGFKPIGFDKSTTPNRLVIDGQQRLTSLYAVFKGKPVLDKDYKERTPKIAFNPINEEFEVSSKIKQGDPEWINNITEIIVDGSSFTFINEYINNLHESKPDLEFNESEIGKRIEQMSNIGRYPFSVLELSPDLNPEEVSEIFVRINSKGKSLNQSDFILTLMSVYWPEGKKSLEEFSKQCKIPSIKESSPYNQIKATPDLNHLLRPAIAYSFLRGRLKYAYLILKGRNLENKTTTKEEREKNFAIYKEAQDLVLNNVNWQNYCRLIEKVGFINYKLLISSEFGFYATYGLYLIGKYKFNLKYEDLNKVIGRWFVFSQLTQRYSFSGETRYEQDLKRLEKSGVDFIAVLDNIIENTLTPDYWNITLPDNLNSSENNYAGKVYTVAKIKEGKEILFSEAILRENLTPEIKATKKSVDLHHIFPKNYLKKMGISDKKDFNQQANLIYLEYQTNIEISDKAPREYWNEKYEKFKEENKQYLLDDYTNKFELPHEFWNMDYFDFLEKRRELMAKAIKEYFEKL